MVCVSVAETLFSQSSGEKLGVFENGNGICPSSLHNTASHKLPYTDRPNRPKMLSGFGPSFPPENENQQQEEKIDIEKKNEELLQELLQQNHKYRILKEKVFDLMFYVYLFLK